MKSVVFSGSIRSYKAMEPWAEFLRDHGVVVELPKLGKSNQYWQELTEAEQRREKLKFIEDHNRRIDSCDVLFVFNPDGYVGNSVTLEIGYALAKNKVIYALHKDQEMGRDVLYRGYYADPQSLLEALR